MRLIYIIGTYPSLTTTFIDREIRTLRSWGQSIQIVSVRHPRGELSPEQKGLGQDVIYLLPVPTLVLLRSHLHFVVFHPVAYLGTFFYLLTSPHPSLKSRWMTFLHFTEGVYAAFVLKSRDFNHIHAHFMDRATTIALVASRLLKVTYSFTAHARDIYVDPIMLTEKLAGASFAATCTAYNKSHLSSLSKNGTREKIKCIYHGLDTSDYQPVEQAQDGRPLIISVGQLKEKKGFTYLLEACRLLKEWGYQFECQIVGGGPMQAMLEGQIHELSLDDVVQLCNFLPHHEVIRKYAQASIFVLPSVMGGDGDRDGIPNVILEAMAMKLPVVSTRHSGIPEAVHDNVNGLLVPPADAPALAKALATLLDHPDLRQQFANRGRQTVIEDFSLEANVNQLLHEFKRVTLESI